MLAILINRAKEEGQFDGIIPHMVDGGLLILQYMDNTVLSMDHDLDKAKNLKLLLCAFEKLSGLKINFHKRESRLKINFHKIEIFCFGDVEDARHDYVELLGCKFGEFLIKYLGIPLHYRKLRNVD
jgi:hypothetical protein